MVLVVFWLLGISYRLWLWEQFYGWEESDYGNLAMVRGVWDSRFTLYDMNHMPGYYAFGAFFLCFTDDTVVAAKLASWIGGSVAFGLAISLVYRLAGYYPAIVTTALLFAQPEFSLYASSALREPVYAALLLGFLTATLWRYYWVAGVCMASAFLFRFEVPLAVIPLYLLWATQKQYRPIWTTTLPLVVTIVLWALYCQQIHGTFQFWAHAAATNVETGLGAEAVSRWDWIQRGSAVAGTLFFELLPSRIGWLVWFGWLLAPLLCIRTSRWIPVICFSYSLVFLWLAIGFIAQHDAEHNLYWKWLCPFVPVVVPVGVLGLVLLSNSWAPLWRYALWCLTLGQALWGNVEESARQIQRSVQLYKPQLVLAKKIEKEAPIGRLMIVDNIPACWIGRKPNDLSMISWFDVPVPKNDPKKFAAWLTEKQVWSVLWFKEDWTKAPGIAPFLSKGGTWTINGVTLTETAREDEYGWINYRVSFATH